MGIEGLYTLDKGERTETGWVFTARLDPAHPVFEGHFPEMPVLPGVCTMHLVKTCAAQAAGRKLAYRTVHEVKFVAAIIPAEDEVLEIRFALQPADVECYSLRGEVVSRGETMFKIKAELA